MPNPITNLKAALNSHPLIFLALSLLFAVLGQFFLIQQGHLETLMIGGLLDLAAILIFIAAVQAGQRAEKSGSLPAPWEYGCLLGILIEAALFRLVLLSQIPAGFNSDTGNEGWDALRIMHEKWFPLMKDIPDGFFYPAPYYEFVGLFHFFSPTPYHIQLYYALVSLVSLGLIYWFFRQLAGVPAALLTLAFIAPMRWDFTLSRLAHPAGDVHWFMFGCLAFGYYALESQKKWAWILSTFFLSLGFYTYESFKPLVLLVVLLLAYEVWTRRLEITRNGPTLKVCVLLFLLLAGPMIVNVVNSGGFADPDDHLFILEKVRQEHSWLPLLENPFRTALMFNHRGNNWVQMNIPGHRLLDDATGILLILGFGFALSRWQERKYFYALAGAAVMCLPATLSINPDHLARTYGALPFIAFLAATGLLEVLGILSQSPSVLLRRGRWALLALVLAWAAFQNGKIYFIDMAQSADFEWSCALKETAVGNLIQADGGKNDYYLTPYFHDNYTVLFLDYFQAKWVHLLPWPGGPWPPAPPSNQGAWFILDRAQTGLLEFLQELYPDGKVQVFQDQQGIARVYIYKVPAAALGPGLKLARHYRDSGQGLLGEYQTPRGLYTQVDPVLNFALRSDFPVQDFPPLQVQWIGRLVVKDSGAYQFLILTTDGGGLVLNGQDMLKSGNQESSPVNLHQGVYSLRVNFNQPQGGVALFHLLWKKPGADRYEVVPASALEVPATFHLSRKSI
jgi:hypothetical protein